MEHQMRVTLNAEMLRAMIREDPIKAAGIAALTYVAFKLTVCLARILWKLRWVIAVVLVVLVILYLTKGEELSAACERVRGRIARLREAAAGSAGA